MDSNAFISTKEAALITGHSPDYIGRLLRAGDIRGVREGKAWRVDQASLHAYLERKQRRGVRRAMELSHVRREQYQTSAGIPRFFTPPAAAAALREPVPAFSQATALAAAAILVVSSALLAQSSLAPQALSAAEPVGRDLAAAADGVKERAGRYIESRIASARDGARASRIRVLTAPDAYAPRPELLALAAFTGVSAGVPTPRSIAAIDIAASAGSFVEAMRVAQQAVRNPSILKRAAHDGSRAVAWRVGVYGLSLGATLRDGLVRAPGTLLALHTGLGRGIVAATHAAIDADVRFAYVAAAATASVTQSFIDTTIYTTDDITSIYALFLTNAGRLVREAPTYAQTASSETIALFSSAYLAAAGASIERSLEEMGR